MKIAIELKNNNEKIYNDLKVRGFKISKNPSGIIWIEHLKIISGNIKSIDLEYKTKSYALYLEDINYFEIQKEND